MWEKLYEKVLLFCKGACYRDVSFWKEKNVTINKRRAKIRLRCKKLLGFGKSLLAVKIIEKLEISVIIQAKIEG